MRTARRCEACTYIHTHTSYGHFLTLLNSMHCRTLLLLSRPACAALDGLKDLNEQTLSCQSFGTASVTLCLPSRCILTVSLFVLSLSHSLTAPSPLAVTLLGLRNSCSRSASVAQLNFQPRSSCTTSVTFFSLLAVSQSFYSGGRPFPCT